MMMMIMYCDEGDDNDSDENYIDNDYDDSIDKNSIGVVMMMIMMLSWQF